ncbi:23S rRNA (pseudouridine(1915)-N(3))-methyltransferase RlmH [candidate division KSB3 bacterium]|uniref:Ribosomal RNA large subunit methyltransferase H n=1 Tax=candidate division KSB3 bacterium TaxID=2044937 RepID=A0A2G6KC26_9BACT|nr:MAG: 23S rRNA (pseudouridine(1915)-N(3))-methyltransferase RlmH [candidate division KSB3 bacterium]
MVIKLVCVGKLKDADLQNALDDYLKRIRHYTTIEYTEIKAEKRRKTERDEAVKQRECEHITKHLTSQDVVVALDEHGSQYSSSEFAHYLSQHQLRGDVKRLTFVTGGATGFSQDFLKRADNVLSLSRMTFPHQLCRLIFVEQVYRACTILAGESYHKA